MSPVDLNVGRESLGACANPLGMNGIEFIEFSTSKPQALGQMLEMLGYRPVARHRSREVLLYRQGDMNIIINAHPSGRAVLGEQRDAPVIAAMALRVRDAGAAYQRALDKGAWPFKSDVRPMELNIPAIHGVGHSRIYFVDRYREFSIYDVDFIPIPTVDPKPPALAGFEFFGVVQYIGSDRLEDWTEFYAELFGFEIVPDEQRFGILPKGRVLRSPCARFFLQLIEPEPTVWDVASQECLQRIALSTQDVLGAVSELRQRGLDFTETSMVHSENRGALTQTYLGGVSFELVHRDAS
jgi:4-hydroxyphenylpyruvate dioxygenase